MPSLVPLNAPQPIHVAVDDHGCPTRIMRGGQSFVVAEILDTWRIDDEWWRDEISRRYHRLARADGTTLTVFHDLIAGGWYVQRYP